ncbi:MAG TPA: ATP-dependent DNA helicase RecG [Alphaproteobacteria bacterium]|nr:ATP-dependent DNA helicase RecG [Alphaproteobacteria bacterium]
MQKPNLPALIAPLFTEMRYQKSVGPARERMLSRLGVRRRVDVLFHLPHSVIQRKEVLDLFAAREGENIIIMVEVEQIIKPKRRGLPFTVQCVDTSKVPIELVYFNVKGDWIEKLFPLNSKRWIVGKLEMGAARWQILHPENVSPIKPEAFAIEPVYPLTAGLNNNYVVSLVRQVLQDAPQLPEWHDAALLQQKNWQSWRAALQTIHAPQTQHDLELDAGARDRLAYDEILAQQLAFALVRRDQKKLPGISMPPKALREKILAALPFQLTEQQEKVITEIDADMAKPERMRRLLQGDVGSGKTIIALLAMLNAVEAGRQAAIMAPTEILARQHAETLGPLLEKLGIKSITLTGRDTGRDRSGIMESIASGKAQLIIGTHSLFQDGAQFKDLGLIVIDEQHRFGVYQRMKITQKSRGMDMLVMTATPIPRTLALTLYGDMDTSRLMEKPPGRKPCDTRLVSLNKLDEVVAAIGRKIAANEQIFWICPLVEKHEVLKLSDAESRAETLEKFFPGQVALVHGQMNKKQLDIAMGAFIRGDAKILVATTVIEVGVNIPAATVMVIEHAERFGLAQLHQLRGRVGRGSGDATCLLLYGTPLNETAQARLDIMRKSEDGFVIAEKDLELRGTGELMGTRQSGDPEFRLATLAQANAMLEMARRDAELFLEKDAQLTGERGKALRTLLYLMDRDEGVRLLRTG